MHYEHLWVACSKVWGQQQKRHDRLIEWKYGGQERIGDGIVWKTLSYVQESLVGGDH